MISDWIYVEKQRMVADATDDAPLAYLDFYVWQCRYCGVREVTTTPEMPTHGCKCRGNHKSVSLEQDLRLFEQGQWDMFETITSAWYGKQAYALESDGRVWSRESGKYMSVDEAYKEFIDSITAY